MQSNKLTLASCRPAEAEFAHVVDDQLMRFFERCRGYVEGVEKNRTALLEVEKFKRGEEMEAVSRRMAESLGLPQHRLTPGETPNHNSQDALCQDDLIADEVCPSASPVDLVEAAFFLCSYELAIKSVHSPWCFLFDESDAKVGRTDTRLTLAY